jgi:hypothetical protein
VTYRLYVSDDGTVTGDSTEHQHTTVQPGDRVRWYGAPTVTFEIWFPGRSPFVDWSRKTLPARRFIDGQIGFLEPGRFPYMLGDDIRGWSSGPEIIIESGGGMLRGRKAVKKKAVPARRKTTARNAATRKIAATGRRKKAKAAGTKKRAGAVKKTARKTMARTKRTAKKR